MPHRKLQAHITDRIGFCFNDFHRKITLGRFNAQRNFDFRIWKLQIDNIALDRRALGGHLDPVELQGANRVFGIRDGVFGVGRFANIAEQFSVRAQGQLHFVVFDIEYRGRGLGGGGRSFLCRNFSQPDIIDFGGLFPRHRDRNANVFQACRSLINAGNLLPIVPGRCHGQRQRAHRLVGVIFVDSNSGFALTDARRKTIAGIGFHVFDRNIQRSSTMLLNVDIGSKPDKLTTFCGAFSLDQSQIAGIGLIQNPNSRRRLIFGQLPFAESGILGGACGFVITLKAAIFDHIIGSSRLAGTRRSY
ncbi:hypothetical protein SDC9_115569 [bioreactor metagenome]|uniref:Uncharacterized protein n=1 Tax=bioreactor metagenome TaxID=1076179 RepID=A0A645BTI0_9ZZZZ